METSLTGLVRPRDRFCQERVVPRCREPVVASYGSVLYCTCHHALAREAARLRDERVDAPGAPITIRLCFGIER